MMFRFLRRVHHILRAILNTFLQLPKAVSVALEKSYYPERRRKGALRRIAENLYWLLRYHEANVYYNVYGLDLAGAPPLRSYADYFSFAFDRSAKVTRQNYLLRDKYAFYRYMRSCGIPVIDIIAICNRGRLFTTDFEPLSEESFRKEKDYFVKESAGECASFVKHFDDYDAFTAGMKGRNGLHIIQRRLRQCAELDRLNPAAINTLRIVTVNKGEPYLFSAVLRVGTEMSGSVDNWSVGGFAVGIHEDGTLKQYAYTKPGYNNMKIERHPDTGVVFSEFKVPMYREAVQLVCRAHRQFYDIQTIGWDVAITEEGPIIVEGNDNWAINLHQVCDGPLRREWEEAIS